MKIYICSTKGLLDAASFDAASLKIDSHRSEKLNKIKSEADRRRSLCAGLLLNYAVAEYRMKAAGTVGKKCPKDQDAPGFASDDFQMREISLQELLNVEKQEYAYKQEINGKPYISDMPDFYFSLSHSGDYVLCAWDSHEVGGDLQRIDREVKDTLAKKVMTDEEYKIYADLPEHEQKCEFYRIWTIKESYCKLTGKGLSQEFHAIETDKISCKAHLWKENYWVAVSHY